MPETGGGAGLDVIRAGGLSLSLNCRTMESGPVWLLGNTIELALMVHVWESRPQERESRL